MATRCTQTLGKIDQPPCVEHCKENETAVANIRSQWRSGILRGCRLEQRNHNNRECGLSGLGGCSVAARCRVKNVSVKRATRSVRIVLSLCCDGISRGNTRLTWNHGTGIQCLAGLKNKHNTAYIWQRVSTWLDTQLYRIIRPWRYHTADVIRQYGDVYLGERGMEGHRVITVNTS